MRVLYIHGTKSRVRYRREVLRELLEKDGRFDVESVETPFDKKEPDALCDRLERGDYDIVLSSNPWWLGETNGRVVADMASRPEKLVVYDLSDNWSPDELSVRLMRMSDMVGVSARYLAELAKENCPTTGFYPNGVRSSSIERDDSFTTAARYVYAGQLRKLDLSALDRLLTLDPAGEVDVYAVDYDSVADVVMDLVPERVHILEPVTHKDLQGRLHAYRYGLALFKAAETTVRGMLPDKYFDYCQAGIPTVYSNCTELAHEDFKRTAFDVNADGFSLGSIAPAAEDFQAVVEKYDMRKSLLRFIDDMAALYARADRPKAFEKTWRAPWEE